MTADGVVEAIIYCGHRADGLDCALPDRHRGPHRYGPERLAATIMHREREQARRRRAAEAKAAAYAVRPGEVLTLAGRAS